MKIRWTALAATAVLALPGAAWAHGSDDGDHGRSGKNASKLCKALKAEMGEQAFRNGYGSNHNRRNAHGKCVSKHRHWMKRLVAQAVQECKAEQQAAKSLRHDGERTGEERQAFRECVKEKLRAMIADLRAKVDAAVAQCRGEHEADPAAFREKYGKGKHDRRAFKHCVVERLRESTAKTAA